MSNFKDELNRVTQTPHQVIDNQWESKKQEISRIAQTDYKNIKNQLLLNAENGQYILIGNKKHITCKYNSKFLSTCISKHENLRFSFFSGNPITDSVDYKIKNQKEYDCYLSTLQSMARQDDLSIVPMFISVWYQKENRVTLPYTFRKDCVIGHKLNSYLECTIEY